MKKYKILVTENIHPKAMALLEAEAEVTIAKDVEKDTLVEAVKGMDALLIRSSKLYNEVVDAGTDLKVIGRHGIGCDNIDIPYVTSKGIPIVNSPHGNVRSVAERVVAYCLALSGKLLKNDRNLREGVFSVPGASLVGLVTAGGYGGFQISGKTLGIIGYGKIGSLTAQMARDGFGMHILAYDPALEGKIELPANTEFAKSIDEICEKSDYISLNVPLLPSTKNMFSTEQFKKMKNTAYIINCGRGGLIDEEALYEAVKSGEIAGAGVDVFAVEPPMKDNPLFELDNIIFSPHTAGLSEDAMIGLGTESGQGILDILNGKGSPNLVNKDYVNFKR